MLMFKNQVALELSAFWFWYWTPAVIYDSGKREALLFGSSWRSLSMMLMTHERHTRPSATQPPSAGNTSTVQIENSGFKDKSCLHTIKLPRDFGQWQRSTSSRAASKSALLSISSTAMQELGVQELFPNTNRSDLLTQPTFWSKSIEVFSSPLSPTRKYE